MYLVFDIGGTNLRAGYSEDGQNIVKAKTVSTPQNYQEGLKTIIKLSEEFGGNFQKTAIGIAGVVTDNQLTSLANLPDWANQPLATDFKNHFGVAPVIRNDAEMGGLGEAKFGVGKNYHSLLYFTIGTGVGGAWIKQGDTTTTENFEPGRLVIESENQELEKLVIKGSEKAHFLAQGISILLKHYPADAIIIGGGVIVHHRIDVEEIKSELNKLMGSPPPLFKAALGDNAGLQGALAILN